MFNNGIECVADANKNVYVRYIYVSNNGDDDLFCSFNVASGGGGGGVGGGGDGGGAGVGSGSCGGDVSVISVADTLLKRRKT
jgi:hypothetical protein